MNTLTIYHTNDIHGECEAFLGILAFLKDKPNENTLILDAGDFFDLKDITMQGTDGMVVKALLQYGHYDAHTAGNNELDGKLTMLVRMGEQKPPLLSADLFQVNGDPVPNIHGSMLIERAGVKLLIIGLSPGIEPDGRDRMNIFFHMDGLHVDTPLPYIKKEQKRYQGQYDLCILLSHEGERIDRIIAEETSGIDVIIGGHSHTFIEEPYLWKDTIIAQAGNYAQVIGKLELQITDNKITAFDGKLIPNHFSPDPQAIALLTSFRAQAEKQLSTPLFSVPRLPLSYTEESLLPNTIADALYQNYPCDFAFINSGIVSHELDGVISKSVLISCSPSKLNPTRFPITGQQFLTAVKASLDPSHCLSDGRGAGYRGTVIGALAYSHNVSIYLNPFQIVINDTPLDPQKTYLVCADDYLQRGSGYPSLETPREKAEYFPGFIRDLLERTLNNAFLFATAQIKRIQDKKEEKS